MIDHSSKVKRPTGRFVRSYATRFAVDDDPISEGGIWLSGKREGIDWTDVIIKDGRAFGAVSRMGIAERRMEQRNVEGGAAATVPALGDYDDPTALLTGSWGRNQHGKAIVFSRNQTDKYFQEVEIRLRSRMEDRICTGYEVFWRCLKTDKAYAEIARWNGRVTDFTSLRKHFGPQFGVKEGDVVEATIIGNEIKGYVNGVEVISAVDETFEDGSPGIGFNFGVSNTNVDHGFTYFEVDTYDD